MKKLWLMCMLISSAINAQTFDFSCNPFADIIAEFRYDSKYQGSINARLLTRAQIRVTRPLILDEDGVFVSGLRDGVVAYASTNACYPRANFVYVKEWWDDPDHSDAAKKKIIYHEIGHSLYKYMHPLDDADMVTDRFTGNTSPDIMGYNRELVADDSENWRMALERFFAGTNHDLYVCPPRPYAGKGERVIIIDN